MKKYCILIFCQLILNIKVIKVNRDEHTSNMQPINEYLRIADRSKGQK